MAKIVLNDIINTYNLALINANFTKIENELQNKVLYRNNPVGEPNEMQSNLDMNNKHILNLPAPTTPNEPARLQDVLNNVITYPSIYDEGVLKAASAKTINFVGTNVTANALGFDATVTVVSDLPTLAAPGGAALVGNTPAGNISSSTVQSAIDELDTEKIGFSTLASNTGASLVGFTQSGTGATNTTVQNVLRESSSVKRFGAIGNGVVDDSAAIQAAVNAGGLVFVPPGDYLINTGITLPSVSEMVFAPNARFLAGTNNMFVIYTTGGIKSSVKLRNPTIVGNGKTGVTGIKYQNVQFDSFIENPDVSLCANGVVLSNMCIGVVIDKPTTYRTPNGIQIINSNANTVITPNCDNTTSSGGTGTGTGVFFGTGGIAAPSTNQLIGGFIQGFDNGTLDQGYATGVSGVYYEQCNTAAYNGNGALSGVIQNIEFFGNTGTNYAVQMTGCQGMQVLFPKHIKFGGAGALYNVNASNSNCTQIYTTDGGTSNTSIGDISGFRNIPVETNVGTFTPRVEGTTTTGTATYSTQRGRYRILGNRVDFTINLAWSGHTGTGNLIIPGLPVAADATLFADDSFITVTSAFAVTGPFLRGYFSSATPFIQIQQINTSGSASVLALPTTGALNISGSYWKA